MQTTQSLIEALDSLRTNPDRAHRQHFWQLVDRFRADLVNQAFSMLGCRADAEDVAQETLAAAFRDLGELRNPQMIVRWLRKINHHQALKHRQRTQRAKRLLAKGTANADHETSHTKHLTNQEIVAKAIDRLDEDHRLVVNLRYWEHLGYKEIAERLGIPLGTVKSRLARADRLLEKRLRPLYERSA